jgi:heptosyltransferase-2
MKVDHPLKILIIRLSSIGDIILSSPFVRQIKTHFPDAQIDYLIKEQYSELMRFNPYLHGMQILTKKNKKELKNLKKKLKKNSYHIIFDLHNNLRSNYLKRGLNAAKICSIHKSKVKQLLLVYLKINKYRSITSIPERYLMVASEFGVQDDGKGLELFWQPEQNHSALSKAEKAGLNTKAAYICLAPGAAHFTKRWPVESFLKLSEKIEHDYKIKLVVLGGKDDVELGKYLSRPGQIYDLTGKLGLLESAVILSKSMAVVTNDSGLMHMATAVKVPVLAIFGSTVREFGFFPFRDSARVLENKNLACRPCTHMGRSHCPRKHFDCMLKIDSNMVYFELNEWILKKLNTFQINCQ